MTDRLLMLLRKLPRRIQTSLYHRFLANHQSWYAAKFNAARLSYEPSVVMQLSPADGFHGEIALFGLYEEELTKLLHGIAKDRGGLLLDVGANYGYFSLLWCGARCENQAAAIEASPANAGPLRHNVTLNRLEERISVREWAASNYEGCVTFNLGSHEETGWGGIATSASNVAPPTNAEAGQNLMVTVPCHRLDAAFPEQEIAVLKIDCEGADAWVIEGAAELLAGKRVRHVFFEENLYRQSQLGIQPSTALRMLERYGYQWESLGDEPGIQNFHAWF
ncbi:MAG TPA: hypothetical protein DDZ88_22165 [Verrucomicrobiales bacterium]|nr:hypothetical protein [Verrucomicrobiales bacterium]